MSNDRDRTAQTIDPIRTRLWWGMFLGWWTVMMFLFAIQIRLGTGFRGDPRPWPDALAVGALDAYTWGILALVAVWLARRYPLAKTRWPRLLAVHLPIAVFVVVARLGFFSVVATALQISSLHRLGFWERIVIAFPTNLLVYLLMVGVGYTLEVFRRFRERELAAAQLEARVATARLDLLTNQLQPRFVFTALRSISSLMHRDVAAADRTLALLGDLLRTTLQRESKEVVPLREEIEFLQLYLRIEQARYGEALRVEWDIRPDLLDLPVPHLILQPLVENAIRCGAHPDGIRIVVDVEAGRLILEVRDGCTPSRAGYAEDQPEGPSTATGGEWTCTEAVTKHTEARLAQRYRGEHRFHVGHAPDGGTTVRMELPLEETPARRSTSPVAEAGVPVGAAL